MYHFSTFKEPSVTARLIYWPVVITKYVSVVTSVSSCCATCMTSVKLKLFDSGMTALAIALPGNAAKVWSYKLFRTILIILVCIVND